MDVTKMLNEYIETEGKGNTRDALNVALARQQVTKESMQSLVAIWRQHSAAPGDWLDHCADMLEKIIPAA